MLREQGMAHKNTLRIITESGFPIVGDRHLFALYSLAGLLSVIQYSIFIISDFTIFTIAYCLLFQDLCTIIDHSLTTTIQSSLFIIYLLFIISFYSMMPNIIHRVPFLDG